MSGACQGKLTTVSENETHQVAEVSHEKEWGLATKKIPKKKEITLNDWQFIVENRIHACRVLFLCHT